MLTVTHLLAIVFAAFHLVELDLGFAGVRHDLADDLDSLDERLPDPNVTPSEYASTSSQLMTVPGSRSGEDVHDLVRLYPKLFARKANDRVHSDTS